MTATARPRRLLDALAMRTDGKLPRCYGDYGKYGKLCELECYWCRSCLQQKSIGGISVPIPNDRFPKTKEELKK